MDLSNLLSYVSVVVALVAGGGLGLQRQRVSVLRSDLNDARRRVDDVRGDLSEAERDRAKDKARIAQLESDLRHAEHLALREEKWADLDHHLDEHHKSAMKAWADIKRAIEAIRRSDT